jgi:PIN domain nuclease of toxin-antitoxin system
MTTLIDTHTLLWFVWDDPKLSMVAKSIINDPNNVILVSVASCWEIAIKVNAGKMNLGEPASVFLPREIHSNRLDLLPITLEHALAIESLPLHHRDPFDRLLVAQAIVEKVPIISVDAALDPYPVQRLW